MRSGHFSGEAGLSLGRALQILIDRLCVWHNTGIFSTVLHFHGESDLLNRVVRCYLGGDSSLHCKGHCNNVLTALDEIHWTVILVNFYNPAGLWFCETTPEHKRFITIYCLKLQTKLLCKRLPCMTIFISSRTVYQSCSRNSLRLNWDKFSLQNVSHALKHTNRTYQWGCVQPVGISRTVWSPHPWSFCAS